MTPLVINDLPTSILKLVLATAITTEKAGKSDVGDSLFESVRQTADRYLHNEAVDVKSLPLLVLVVSLNSPWLSKAKPCIASEDANFKLISAYPILPKNILF